MTRTTSTKWSVKTAVGLLVTGGLLLALVSWGGLAPIKPIFLPGESMGPMMPFLPLTTIHLLNLLP